MLNADNPSSTETVVIGFPILDTGITFFLLIYGQDQYWPPPDFKRLLSAKLKALTSSGKLIKVTCFLISHAIVNRHMHVCVCACVSVCFVYICICIHTRFMYLCICMWTSMLPA